MKKIFAFIALMILVSSSVFANFSETIKLTENQNEVLVVGPFHNAREFGIEVLAINNDEVKLRVNGEILHPLKQGGRVSLIDGSLLTLENFYEDSNSVRIRIETEESKNVPYDHAIALPVNGHVALVDYEGKLYDFVSYLDKITGSHTIKVNNQYFENVVENKMYYLDGEGVFKITDIRPSEIAVRFASMTNPNTIPFSGMSWMDSSRTHSVQAANGDVFVVKIIEVNNEWAKFDIDGERLKIYVGTDKTFSNKVNIKVIDIVPGYSSVDSQRVIMFMNYENYSPIVVEEVDEYNYNFKFSDYDLKDFPELMGDFVIVIGDTAPSTDVVAATDIIQGVEGKRANNAYRIGAAKLASEISTLTNIISVGSPCNNPITKKISGVSDCNFNLQPGQGFIGLYKHNDLPQIVVAGYSQEDIRLAARALANWKGSQGTAFIVEGSMDNPIVSRVHRDSFKDRVYNDYNDDVAIPDNDLTPPSFPSQNTISLKLHKGWNLVSLPGSLVKFLDNDCAKKPAAFVYLKGEQQFVTLQVASDMLGDDLNKYLADNAFWVYSYDDCSQKVVIDENYQPEISLSAGWSLIHNFPNLTTQCAGSCIHYWWDATKQQWTTEEVYGDFLGRAVHSDW